MLLSYKRFAYMIANIMLLLCLLIFNQAALADTSGNENTNIYDRKQYYLWKQYADMGLAPYNTNNPQVNAWVKSFDGNGPSNSNGACALVSFAIQAARAGIDTNPKKVFQKWGSVYANWQYPGVTNIAMHGNVSSSRPFGKDKALALIEKYCQQGCFLILGGRNWAHSAPASHFVALRTFNPKDKSFTLYDPARDSKDAQSAGSNDDFLNKITQIVAIAGPISWQQAQKDCPAASGMDQYSENNKDLSNNAKNETESSDSFLHKFFSPFLHNQADNINFNQTIANNQTQNYSGLTNDIHEFSLSFMQFSKNVSFYLFFALISSLTIFMLIANVSFLKPLLVQFNKKSAIQLPIINNKIDLYKFIMQWFLSSSSLLIISSGSFSQFIAHFLIKIFNLQ